MNIEQPSTTLPNGNASALREKLGICQWFHYEAHTDVLKAIDILHDLGVKHLRTGISWADFLRPAGKAWYDWQMQTLHDAGFQILLSVWHVPPSHSEDGSCTSPPRCLRDYADFIDQVITLYGDQFDALELWNEPNNRWKWNFVTYDPAWKKFGEMVGTAAYWACIRRKVTVLGGMMPIDHHWLNLMHTYNVMPYIDVVALHGFPEMWWNDAPNWEWYQHWRGWAGQIDYITPAAAGRPIWITETGLATWDMHTEQPGRHQLQVKMLEEVVTAPVDRIYWYSAIDLAANRDAIEGFHVDENEYHLGLVTEGGEKKPAYYRFQELLRESP
jgi:CDP-paratose 2-epimerase